MATIGSLAVNIVAKTDRFTKGIMKAQSGIVRFGKSVMNITKQVAMFGAGIAAAGAATLTYLVKGQFSAVDALAKTSDRLGIATEKLAGLRLAAEETGVSTATLEMAMQRMVRRVAEAAQGTGEAQGALKELGLNAATLNQLSPDEQLRQIAGAMSGVANQGDKVRLAMKLFDSEGVALVNTLKLGTAGLDEAQAAADRLGLTVSREMAAGVERANAAFGRLKMAVVGLARQLAVRLAPIMEKASKWMEQLLTDDGRIHKWANMIAAAIGGAIAAILDGIKELRVAFHRTIKEVQEQYLDFSRSPLGQLAGMGMTQQQQNDMQFSAMQHGGAAARLEQQDPGGEFMVWFNKHLDKAFNTVTPEAKKSENIIGKWAEQYASTGLQGIGKFIGENSGVMGKAMGVAAESIDASVVGGKTGSPTMNSALRKGTSEASLAVAKDRASQQQKKREEQKIDLLGAIRKASEKTAEAVKSGSIPMFSMEM